MRLEVGPVRRVVVDKPAVAELQVGERPRAHGVGHELVALVTNVVKDRFPGWEEALDQLADQVVTTIEEKKNEDKPKQLLLEGPK